MSKPAPAPEPQPRRLDRILAYMAFGITLVSIAAFFAIMIGTATGMDREDFSGGIWPAVAIFPMIGLPIAFALILTLIIMTFVRRGRAGRAGA